MLRIASCSSSERTLEPKAVSTPEDRSANYDELVLKQNRAQVPARHRYSVRCVDVPVCIHRSIQSRDFFQRILESFALLQKDHSSTILIRRQPLLEQLSPMM